VDAGNVFAVRCRNEWTVLSAEETAGIAWNIDTLAELVETRIASRLKSALSRLEGINGSPLSGSGKFFAGTRIELFGERKWPPPPIFGKKKSGGAFFKNLKFQLWER